MKTKMFALITARGGSKGVPRKNVRDLNGLPLIAHTINAARDSCLFDRIIVSTDDEEIKEISKSFGADVIDRPKALARDASSSLDVIEHALRSLSDEKFIHFFLLQPTSPLRKSWHIVEAWEKYVITNALSLVSVQKTDHSPYKMLVNKNGEYSPLFSLDDLTRPRQEQPNTYMPNGAIYISSVDLFLKNKNLFEAPLAVYSMDAVSSMDIDTEIDFSNCEKLLNKNK